MRARFALSEPGEHTVVHEHRVRVGYVDTDRAGVAHHTRYLIWIEAARIEYLRARGLDYRRFEEETGLGMPVIEARVKYLAPARFDDELIVATWTSTCSRARVVFDSRIRRAADGLLLCEARIDVACVDVREARACSVPDPVRRACE